MQKLASKYRLKISSDPSVEITNKILDDKSLISTKEKSKNISTANLSIKMIHWANRDFSEYKEAA